MPATADFQKKVHDLITQHLFVRVKSRPLDEVVDSLEKKKGKTIYCRRGV